MPTALLLLSVFVLSNLCKNCIWQLMQNKEDEKWLIARPLGLHYNLHVSPSVHDQLNENVHVFCSTWYILIKFCTQMHVDSIQH